MQDEKLLDEYKANGKQRDWDGRKEKTETLGESYRRLKNTSKAARVYWCGSWLEFKNYYEKFERKFHGANFCKVRLCPMCAARRSEKIFIQVSKVMNYVQENKDYRYIFLSLTVRNVSGDDLSKMLDDIFYGFNKLSKRREFKKIAKGTFRSLEVTRNEKTGEYHPHIHMIIGVNKSYFTGDSNYIGQLKWRQLWQECMKLDYDPWVDVRTIRASIKQNSRADMKYGAAVAEISKYTVKASNYLVAGDPDQTDETVAILDAALKDRRLVAFGGEFKKIHKQLNLDDPLSGDLAKIGDETEIRNDLKYIIEHWKWNTGFKHYFLDHEKNPE